MAEEEEQDQSTTANVTTMAEEQSSSSSISHKTIKRFDSFDIESRTYLGHGSHDGSKVMKWSTVLHLAFQSIGIVYGDIGTSPLYVYASTFPNGIIKHEDDILGAFSIIFYTITLSTLVKYVFIVLRATDNGDGGTFALYSLICRYAKVGLTPSEQAEDTNISNFKLELPTKRVKLATWVKSRLEKSDIAKYFLLIVTFLGTSMLIGDGIFTPCISVLSAVGGIKEADPSMTQDKIVWASVAILIMLFMVQRFGTDKVGYTFSPLLLLWFALISSIGLYNFIKFDWTVIRAINPGYIVTYFIRNKKDAWLSLCGTVLSITGAEALFADVGHFSVKSIRISTCFITYPAIILAYAGQSAFLRKHPDLVSDIFYKSIPGPMYWPMFVVAILAAIIASQSLISGTFSIVQQSLSMGCFPRVKIIHTSATHKGQVYIPEVNYLLMVACVAVTLGFKTGVQLGNAYGLAVVFVMIITSSFLVIIMTVIWKTHILLILLYIVTIGTMEVMYLTSVLYKFDQGGYLPLAFATILVTIMFVWHNVYLRKYKYESNNKVSPQMVNDIMNNIRITRMPGIALFYSELVQGIPPIFKHYVQNMPALHSTLIFVSKKSLPISKVSPEERFLFRRLEPKELNMFRCVARYGYRDSHKESEPFEKMLVDKLKEFIMKKNSEEVISSSNEQEELLRSDEIERIDKAFNDHGVVHLMGESQVFAGAGANLGKKILIDYAYDFLVRNLRQSSNHSFDIPHKRMVKVGMTYEL
ncbi:potassium transporter 5 [Cannabis sativa]|uniref:potassium transporter 5 n=1 Tax=Cannabis sativa TaxID=3483 RepID=UPI0029CA7EEA|nr:potassium transporter 5 [Cannabis sativa]